MKIELDIVTVTEIEAAIADAMALYRERAEWWKKVAAGEDAGQGKEDSLHMMKGCEELAERYRRDLAELREAKEEAWKA